MRRGIVVRNSKDVTLKNNRFHNIHVGIDVDNVELLKASGNVSTWDTDPLLAEFPILKEADHAQMLEAADLVSTAEPDQREVVLKSSRLGKWLAQQSFVDWATLVVSLSAIVS